MAQNKVDDLNAPLGRKKSKTGSGKDKAKGLPFAAWWARIDPRQNAWPYGRLMAGLLVVAVAALFVRIASVDEPAGGRPSTEIEISNVRETNPVANEVTDPDQQSMLTIGEQFPAPELDIGPDGPNITADDLSYADRQLNAFGAYPELLEQTQHGPVPHIGVSGERPFDAYARASVGPEGANGKPLVAIVVSGLGLNESGSLDAISKLPDNITLAFAPYGNALERVTAEAREEGHELWLEVPMEPFDYPQSDPGPHTLLVNQPLRSNLDKMIWLMARFGGYAGIINHLGARFTSTAADFSPVMEEVGTRGLGYIDDGSSNRSLAAQLASANRVPFARANIELDANPSRAAILQALDRLVERARTEGSAVGIVSALPVSIDTVASWAANIDDEGLLLVPASALMQGSN